MSTVGNRLKALRESINSSQSNIASMSKGNQFL